MPKNWKNKNASDYAYKLQEAYGKPMAMDDYMAHWMNVGGFYEVWVRDESIAHNFPEPHRDFVYSSKKIPAWAPKDGQSRVSPGLAGRFAAVSGSIIIDGLKGEVTARCGMIIKNAVTIGFVEDVVAGSISATPAEYSRRIKGNITPNWFKDEMGEAKPKDESEAGTMKREVAAAAKRRRRLANG